MCNRRHFLRESAAAVSAWSVLHWFPRGASAIDFTEPVREADGLTAYQKDGCIQVRFDNLPLVSYRAQPSLKYPYFFPLNGPISGLSLTAESALPYPHHRGLWLGCDPLNRGNYWADNGLESGQIRSVELQLDSTSTSESTVSFTERCVWSRQGSNPFNDLRRYAIHRPDERHVFLDCDFQLTASEDVSISKAKHSFFAMRAAADISPSYGGTLINSEGGTGAKGTYGKTADWCGYFGKRHRRPDVVEGIVIMNHPDNFGGNCPWFTREYGHLSPSPFYFRDKPWTLAKGKSIRLNYRVVLFAGTPHEAGLDAIYKKWIA
jgi:hypothetical protein